MDNINLSAERMVLSALAKHPEYVFEYHYLCADDFATDITSATFQAIKGIAEEQGGKPDEIEGIALEEKIAFLFPALYGSNKREVHNAISSIKSSPVTNNIEPYITIVISNSVKRKTKERLREIERSIDNCEQAADVLQLVENDTFDFVNSFSSKDNDIELIGEGFDEWIGDVVKKCKEGRLETGVNTGFSLYDDAIGGGLERESVHTIAGRSKMGKSFLALTMAYNIASQGIPVLYLDTELNKRIQWTRLAGMLGRVPMRQVKYGTFAANEEYREKMKEGRKQINSLPMSYVTIKGTTIEQQISLIRRWFAKVVGKNEQGQYNRAVVILDYLKLMRPGDKGYQEKEWEALGYRVSLLHDLSGEYETSVLMFAQQNRDGLEKEDESTISGSDRIIWLSDSFSIFSAKPEIEMAAIEEKQNENIGIVKKVANSKLKVVNTREGPGTKGDLYIGIYSDIKDRQIGKNACGIIEEVSLEKPYRSQLPPDKSEGL